MAKKMLVQMTTKKSAYGKDRHIYHPGDTFEVTETEFRPDFMVKVAEPKPSKPPKQEPKSEEAPEEAVVAEEPVKSDVVFAQAAPKVRRRRT